MRGLVIFFVAFLFGNGVWAQSSPEQLKRSLADAKLEDNALAAGKVLSDLGVAYMQKKQWDSAATWLYAASKWNSLHNHQLLVGRNLNDLGVVAEMKDFLDSAIYYYEKAIPLLQKAGDFEMVNSTRVNLGAVYKEVGLYPESLEISLEAALELEKQPPSYNLGRCYNSIALVYARLEEYDKAFEFHRKGLKVKGALNNSLGLAGTWNNIANLHLQMSRYDSAMYYYRQSLDIKRAIGDTAATATTLHNIGDLLMKMENPLAAEPYYEEALALKKKRPDESITVSTFTSLAQLNLSQGQPQKANRFLDSAEQIAARVGLLEELKTIYEMRVKMNESEGSFKDALNYSIALAGVKDSLLTAEMLDEVRAITTKYEVGRIEQVLNQEKDLRRAEVKAKQAWIVSLALIIILLVAIGLLIFYQFKIARKNKQRVELLLKELHHRVKNNLQILSSVLTFQSQELTDKGAIEAVRNSESRINAMALIHRKLYRTEQNRTIGMKEYILELIEFLLYSNGYTPDKLQLTLDLDDFHLDVDRAIPLGLIINELVNNAFKHAINKHKSPALTVSSKVEGGRDVKITISDNGLCPPNPADELTSFGLKMVNALLQELRGSMDSDYREGTIFQLHIPA